MATKTTIYSFNATVQNANTNQARNLALQGLYNNMKLFYFLNKSSNPSFGLNIFLM